MEEVIEETKRLLGRETEDAELFAQSAVYYIKSYCRLEAMPRQLVAIAARISAAMFRESGGVSSIKEGDRQVDYFSVSDTAQTFKKYLEPFVNRAGRVPSEIGAAA